MVSIIIPVYNGAKFVEKTILSALSQNIQKEVIAIDDCSTDNSYEILKSLAAKHSELTVVKNDINLGACKTVIKGVELAKGNYLLMLGHDDLLEPYHCRKMLEKFDDETSLVFCDYDLIDENDNIYNTNNHCKHRDIAISDFYKHNAVPSVGLIMSKNKFTESGGYCYIESFPNYVEYHLWIRMALCGKITFCESTRAKYRRHSTNMTNDFNNKETIKKLNKYFNICKKQILNSPKISLMDKAFVIIYMIYKNISTNIKLLKK